MQYLISQIITKFVYNRQINNRGYRKGHLVSVVFSSVGRIVNPAPDDLASLMSNVGLNCLWWRGIAFCYAMIRD